MTEQSQTRIIVGIDGSPAAAEAMCWAAEEARLRGATLVLAYAGAAGSRVELSEETNDLVRKESWDYGHQLLAEAIATLAETHPTVLVRTQLDSGDASAMLIAHATSCDDVIVVGRSRGPRLAHTLLGSVGRKVAAHATSTVVIAGPVGPDPHAPVLVGVSNSDGGLQAMRFACTEARLRGVAVRGLRAWSAREWGFDDEIYLRDDLWRESEQLLTQTWVERARAEFPDVDITAEATDQPIFHVLVSESEHAQLLVLGCRRTTDAVLPRLGPISSWLADNSRCALAIVDRLRASDHSTGAVPS